jgi:hypothetical protein
MTGDPGVPVATATALMRAAGFVDYLNDDPRYGKSQMQQLIDVGFVEGVERTKRYQDPMGKDVLMDVDVFQNISMANDGFGTPNDRRPDSGAPPIRVAATATSVAVKKRLARVRKSVCRPDFSMSNPTGEREKTSATSRPVWLKLKCNSGMLIKKGLPPGCV